jgi:hypothetical protein
MMATEFILKGVKVRVNAIAPGVYESGSFLSFSPMYAFEALC